MAPNIEAMTSTYTRTNNFPKPSRLSNVSLTRTVSDITFHKSKEVLDNYKECDEKQLPPPVSEAEDVKCECCEMNEECTPEYIEQIRNNYLGKWICGLCSEAVKEEMGKIGGGKNNNKIEEALSVHMNRCTRFSKFGMAILRKGSRLEGKNIWAKTFSHRDRGGQNKGGLARSPSCIPAIAREMNDLKITPAVYHI